VSSAGVGSAASVKSMPAAPRGTLGQQPERTRATNAALGPGVIRTRPIILETTTSDLHHQDYHGHKCYNQDKNIRTFGPSYGALAEENRRRHMDEAVRVRTPTFNSPTPAELRPMVCCTWLHSIAGKTRDKQVRESCDHTWSQQLACCDRACKLQQRQLCLCELHAKLGSVTGGTGQPLQLLQVVQCPETYYR
jgi:hypothetical protein